MKFTKMQGAGNDFILVEPGDAKYDWAQLAVALCDRHYGIGADGLLLLLPSDVANFRMRMFNPDGSESEACGNGLRCLVKYFIARGPASSGTQEILVETVAGIRRAEMHEEVNKGKVQTSMGVPRFEANDIPVVIGQGEANLVDIKSMITYTLSVNSRVLHLNLVSTGNAHALYFSQRPVSRFPLHRFGPKIEHHKMFPKGVNFEVARVLNRQQIEARVWERGAGETLACGSGACAITVAARMLGYVDNKVDIKLPGGILEVEWDGVGELLLSGPAEMVFTGEWPE